MANGPTSSPTSRQDKHAPTALPALPTCEAHHHRNQAKEHQGTRANSSTARGAYIRVLQPTPKPQYAYAMCAPPLASIHQAYSCCPQRFYRSVPLRSHFYHRRRRPEQTKHVRDNNLRQHHRPRARQRQCGRGRLGLTFRGRRARSSPSNRLSPGRGDRGLPRGRPSRLHWCAAARKSRGRVKGKGGIGWHVQRKARSRLGRKQRVDRKQ